MTGKNTIAGDKLKSFIERVERLEEERKAIGDDIKDIFGEAKSQGFDAKIMKKVIALRRMDSGKRREEQEMLDLYMQSLGLLD